MKIGRCRRAAAITIGHISFTMKLRLATLADASTIEAWDREPHVIAASGADPMYDWRAELPRVVPWREFLIAEIDGRPIGIMQIIDPEQEESHYWGDIAPNLRAIDIWIGDARDLGRGHGTEMMRLAIERCFAAPEVTAILIDPLVSNTDAHRFYERIGFLQIERRTFEGDDCYVYRLERTEWLRPRSAP
jgi:aminoglycoside 6'-N-acetyltransferase